MVYVSVHHRRFVRYANFKIACSGIDEDISPQALEFWQTYAETVNDYRFDSEGGQMPWIDASQQRLMTVIEACWTKIRMPPPEVTATWSSDSDAKLVFSSFRQDVYSILEGSYPLLGVDLFEKLASLALQSINARDWIPLEATLFCINALSDSVAHEDLAHEILSRLFGSEMFAFMTNAEEVRIHFPACLRSLRAIFGDLDL